MIPLAGAPRLPINSIDQNFGVEQLRAAFESFAEPPSHANGSRVQRVNQTDDVLAVHLGEGIRQRAPRAFDRIAFALGRRRERPSNLEIGPAFRIQKPYAPDELSTRFLFYCPVTIAAQLPVPDHHGHMEPDSQAAKRLPAEVSHHLGVSAHFGVSFKVIFAPTA